MHQKKTDQGREPVIDVRHHSPEDFEVAWAAMDVQSRLRLEKVARVLQRPPLLDAHDVLQEAYLGVISGSRRWPIGLGFIPFMVQTMRSVADVAAKKIRRQQGLTLVVTRSSDGGGNLELAGPSGRVGLPVQAPPTAEATLIGAEDASAETVQLAAWRRRVLALFEHNDKAKLLVEGMLVGWEGEDLQEWVGLSGTAFNNLRRLVRRRIEKLEEEVRADRGHA